MVRAETREKSAWETNMDVIKCIVLLYIVMESQGDQAALSRNCSIPVKGKASSPSIRPTQPVFMGHRGISPRWQSGQGVKMMTCLHLVLCTWTLSFIRKGKAVPVQA